MTGIESGARRRPRSPQGEGGRLRAELIAAADRILERTGDEEGLSLRAVAREAGVAAPSIYLHFADKRALVWAVLEARFAELAAAVNDAVAVAPDPAGELRAGCLAYCRFALDHPGAYRVLFGNRTALTDDTAFEQSPGGSAFFILVDGIRACIDAGVAPPGDPLRAATNVWTALHGIVSLRSAAPAFPWPPLPAQIDDILAGLVGLRSGTEADGDVPAAG
jgi:AcrR family transcriptional regulator